MDPVKAASDITVLLATYGPWALVAITVVIAVLIVRWMTASMNKQIADLNAQLDKRDKTIDQKDEQLFQLVERRHEEFKRLMEETASALSIASETNKRMIEAVARCERSH